MGELDGDWRVSRLSGALPPLWGVRKRITGARGSTIVLHERLTVPFDVVGRELRYRAPFKGFVDVLDPGTDSFHGTWTFRGRELGRFELTRVE